VENVTADDIWDDNRMRTDPAYRRAISHLNLFTYLAAHGDSRKGNLLISTDPERPRAFTVDNGLTFGSLIENPMAQQWKELRVSKLPTDTVHRLRAIESKAFDSLGTVAQYVTVNDRLLPAPPTASLDPNRTVRIDDGVLQLGLTADQIQGVRERWHALLLRIEQSEVALVP
jgi:hypothetical protein